MAVDDTSLIAEVRVLTDYDETILTDSEMAAVVDLAKQEITAELGDDTLTFFSGDANADRALFWLTGLFCKAKTGEIDAPNISISSLRIRQASEAERIGLWLSKFEVNFNMIGEAGTETAGMPMGITSVERADRTYSFGE
jgi:hypothetical protein